MSMNPVQGIAINEGAVADLRARREQTAPAQRAASRPNSGTVPKAEVRLPQNARVADEMPQDEVEVHRDSEANGAIVIRYLDHSGNLILQVPNSQRLGMMRAMNRDLQQQAKIHEHAGTAQDAAEERKTDGH